MQEKVFTRQDLRSFRLGTTVLKSLPEVSAKRVYDEPAKVSSGGLFLRQAVGLEIMAPGVSYPEIDSL